MEAPIPKCVLVADRHHGLTEGGCTLLQTVFDLVVMVVDEPTASVGRSRLRAACPGMKVIVLSVHDESGVERAALTAGADVFLLKRRIGSELIPASEALIAGRPYPATSR